MPKIGRPTESIFSRNEGKGIFAAMREEMEEKKAEEAPVAAEAPVERRGDFFNKVSEDDGIDVPVFLRKNQD